MTWDGKIIKIDVRESVGYKKSRRRVDFILRYPDILHIDIMSVDLFQS